MRGQGMALNGVSIVVFFTHDYHTAILTTIFHSDTTLVLTNIKTREPVRRKGAGGVLVQWGELLSQSQLGEHVC